MSTVKSLPHSLQLRWGLRHTSLHRTSKSSGQDRFQVRLQLCSMDCFHLLLSACTDCAFVFLSKPLSHAVAKPDLWL